MKKLSLSAAVAFLLFSTQAFAAEKLRYVILVDGGNRPVSKWLKPEMTVGPR